MSSWDFLGGQIYATWQDFPDAKKCQGRCPSFMFWHCFCFNGTWSAESLKESWQNVNFTKDCGAKAVFAAKKKIHNPQHISWLLQPLTTSGTISTQTATIKSQLKNTLGHLRLWQSIARIRTQRLLFQRQMIGEEIELFRYAQRNGYYPPFKSRFESMIFRFLFGWICDRFPGGYVYNTRMRGMVIPLYCALWKIRVETSSSGIGMPLKWPMDTPNSDGETCTRWEKNQL